MTKNKRVPALLIAAAVCFVMLFSSVFIVVNTGHDCTGESCPICCQINLFENTLKTLSNTFPAIALALALTYSVLACLSVFTAARQTESLVTLKVKLSNSSKGIVRLFIGGFYRRKRMLLVFLYPFLGFYYNLEVLNMKKIITILFAAILMAAMLSACANTSDSSYSNVQKADGSGGSGNLENSDTSGKISIVTTLFPEYDWVREILGDKTEQAELTILLDNGVDLHSYQPTADDLVKIANCDMFIYVGGESDEWVEDALGQAENKDMAVISLLDVLGDSVKAEETVEGMQEEEHEHSHDGEIPEE